MLLRAYHFTNRFKKSVEEAVSYLQQGELRVPAAHIPDQLQLLSSSTVQLVVYSYTITSTVSTKHVDTTGALCYNRPNKFEFVKRKKNFLT